MRTPFAADACGKRATSRTQSLPPVRVSPLPDDPIGAVAGSFAGPGPSVDEMIRQQREEEAEAEDRKFGELGASR